MANVNVNRNIDDAFYRYKMPRILAKVEGKGNGIKTVIVNMPEIAKALSRPPMYPTKYFGCELGAQTQFDTKNDRFIVNGSHDSSKLQDLLDGFVKRFVLCPECENPETNLTVLPKKGIIIQRCIACGHQNNVDMRHKLTTFILKNPGDQDSASGTTPNKQNKKERRLRKSGKSDAVNGDAEEPQEKDKTKKRSSGHHDDEDDVDWGEDTSAEAVQKRMADLSSAAKIMTLSEDLEKSPQERVDLFYTFVKTRKMADQLTGLEREKEVVIEADRLEVKDKAPMVLVELLYDANILTQIAKYKTLFMRFTHQDSKAQKYLLGGFEQLVGVVHKDTLLPKVPHILKTFYDNDLLEEETIIDWDKKASKKYVSKEVSKEIHGKAGPFIKWLQEAEEESSDEDDDEGKEEEDVEVIYSHTDKVGTQTIPKEHAGSTNAKEEEEEDDFDIDAI